MDRNVAVLYRDDFYKILPDTGKILLDNFQNQKGKNYVIFLKTDKLQDLINIDLHHPSYTLIYCDIQQMWWGFETIDDATNFKLTYG